MWCVSDCRVAAGGRSESPSSGCRSFIGKLTGDNNRQVQVEFISARLATDTARSPGGSPMVLCPLRETSLGGYPAPPLTATSSSCVKLWAEGAIKSFFCSLFCAIVLLLLVFSRVFVVLQGDCREPIKSSYFTTPWLLLPAKSLPQRAVPHGTLTPQMYSVQFSEVRRSRHVPRSQASPLPVCRDVSLCGCHHAIW